MGAISINHNLLATDTANTLTTHYGRLATSTQRLSSGLRINSAADDAAGLAIRELQRSEIAALNQGVRNATDAISLIQTMDGALGVIDEKLIRMKELAEQAATGTYDSTQRLMIDSEFQAMAEEIDRIARATDFNGIKLIDGAFEAKPNRVVGSDGKTYDIALTGNYVNLKAAGSASATGGWDTSGITDPSKLVGTTTITLTNENIVTIGNNMLLVTPFGATTTIPPGTNLNISYSQATANALPGSGGWSVNGSPAVVGSVSGFVWTDAANGISITTTLANGTTGDAASMGTPGAPITTTWSPPNALPSFSTNKGTVTAKQDGNILELSVNLGDGNTVKQSFNVANGNDQTLGSVTFELNIQEVVDDPDADKPQFDDPLLPNYEIPDDVIRIHFGPGADKAEDFYDLQKHDATINGLFELEKNGLTRADINIKTQESAQEMLVKVDGAIEQKDKIRAEYGAMQNRLENTVANLKIQAENTQAAESRISDADIAIEMTNFVRNQILTQSAVAMLAQANSVPQMVMRLVGA